RGRPGEAELFRGAARTHFEKCEVDFVSDGERIDDFVSAGGCLRDAGDWDAAKRFLEKALALACKLAGENSAEPVYRQRVAECHYGLGVILQRRGNLREAADQFRQAVVSYERLAAEYPGESAYRWRQ